MRRVLLVHHRSEIGGGERSILGLLSEMNQARYEVSIACPSPGTLVDSIRNIGVKHYPIRFGRLRNLAKLAASILELAGLTHRGQFDILHSNGPATNVPTAIAGRLLGRKVIWHERVLIDDEGLDLDRWLAFLPSLIICNSNAIRHRFRGVRGYDRRVMSILNGVDIEAFSPEYISPHEAKARLGLEPSNVVVGSFDRLDPIKNHEVVLKAFHRVHRDLPNTVLVLAGEALSDHEVRLRSLIQLATELNLVEAVRFLGFVEDVRDVMGACSLVVQASRSEGCSRVLCEAAAMGVPVVASNVGGNPEIVVEGATGHLVASGNVEVLAERVLALLCDETARKSMAGAARDRALKELSLTRYCREIESVYDTSLTRL